MAKLISPNALVLRHQYKFENYFLTHYASQNFHNALTVTFETGEEFLVVLKGTEKTEIFQEVEYFGGENPKIIFTLADREVEACLTDERNLNQNFFLEKIDSRCHILEYDESKLPKKNWRTRTPTRNGKRGTAWLETSNPQ